MAGPSWQYIWWKLRRRKSCPNHSDPSEKDGVVSLVLRCLGVLEYSYSLEEMETGGYKIKREVFPPEDDVEPMWLCRCRVWAGCIQQDEAVFFDSRSASDFIRKHRMGIPQRGPFCAALLGIGLLAAQLAFQICEAVK